MCLLIQQLTQQFELFKLDKQKAQPQGAPFVFARWNGGSPQCRETQFTSNTA
jgi:hypothetical protein